MLSLLSLLSLVLLSLSFVRCVCIIMFLSLSVSLSLSLSLYIYIYISNWRRRSGGWGQESQARLVRIFLRSFCADPLSPRISAIIIGHFTRTNHRVSQILRKSGAEEVKLVAHGIPSAKSRRATKEGRWVLRRPLHIRTLVLQHNTLPLGSKTPSPLGHCLVGRCLFLLVVSL